MENKKQDKEISIQVGEPLEMPKIDIKPYIGKKVKVVSVKNKIGDYGVYAQLETEIVETLGTKEKPIEIKGNMIIGLIEIDGKFGVGIGTKGETFLKQHKVNKPNDMIGKTVILQATSPSKNGIEFLTFI